MTIVRVGSNEKYADGWLQAFGKGVKSKKSTDSTAKKKSPKPVKKKAAKKGGKK